ncbi:unnamed protein product, partial [Chrysoparadoxa australica]
GQGEDAEFEDLMGGLELSQMSQRTLLLKKKKELHEIDDALEFVTEKYKQRMEGCGARQADFESKQKDMKSQVLKFEKFIMENDTKRMRAEAKAKHERRVLEQKEQELKQLQEELVTAQRKETALKKQREKLKPYHEYLLSVVAESDQDFEEIADLLNRFRTLSDANRNLKQLCTESEVEMERRRVAMQQYCQDKQNELLVRNSELNERQRDLEAKRGGIKRVSLETETESERVKGECWLN